MDEHEDDQGPIKSPMKRYGSTRKIYLFNSKYSLAIIALKENSLLLTSLKVREIFIRRSIVNLNTCKPA